MNVPDGEKPVSMAQAFFSRIPLNIEEANKLLQHRIEVVGCSDAGLHRSKWQAASCKPEPGNGS
jgi:hypothetical protein